MYERSCDNSTRTWPEGSAHFGLVSLLFHSRRYYRQMPTCLLVIRITKAVLTKAKSGDVIKLGVTNQSLQMQCHFLNPFHTVNFC